MKVSMLFLLSIVLVLFATHKPAFAVQKSYIVYLGSNSENGDKLSVDPEAVTSSHYDLLSSFLQRDAKADDAILYSYNKVFNGFTALLHEDEARELEKHPNVISVFKNQFKKIHTTRSWGFLGLEHNNEVIPGSIWKKANFGKDVIIAHLDTGVWPESRSFSDENMGPIPKKYKGACQNENDPSFRCNRKLIGARYYYKGYAQLLHENHLTFNYSKSPRDIEGHGSHTLSTAGGNPVQGININGFGNGTVVGGSPLARVATYKVCWPVVSMFVGGCSDSDILAAFEDAIEDSVDVISMSLGGSPLDYLIDSISLGSFHAVKNGVSVVASAGNEGPKFGTVSNLAPWLMTVGASTTDREFVSNVSLGNHHILKGASGTHKGLKKFYPIINAINARLHKADAVNASLCVNGTLSAKKANGKIIVCQRGIVARIVKAYEAVRVGAVGMILTNDEAYGMEIVADDFPIPNSHLTFSDSQLLFAYLNSTKSPVATISAGRTNLGIKPAPYMADFSSRGPNIITPGILKPDITAPGVRIIAAYSESAELKLGKAPYSLLDGTSMSCPHIAGIVGLLKSIYPDWSPSAIKSAIMTTARTRDNRRKPLVDFNETKANPFAYGAGHVRPNKAMDPGLVYDMNSHDYLNFLCAIGYNKTAIKKFSKHSYYCPESVSVADINYPTVSIPSFSGNATIVRRVKNVGQPGKYVAHVRAPIGTSVVVKPKTLVFTEKGQELKYKLIFGAKMSHLPKDDYSFGYIVWSDGKHHVRSTIVVKAKTSKHKKNYQL